MGLLGLDWDPPEEPRGLGSQRMKERVPVCPEGTGEGFLEGAALIGTYLSLSPGPAADIG